MKKNLLTAEESYFTVSHWHRCFKNFKASGVRVRGQLSACKRIYIPGSNRRKAVQRSRAATTQQIHIQEAVR